MRMTLKALAAVIVGEALAIMRFFVCASELGEANVILVDTRPPGASPDALGRTLRPGLSLTSGA